MENNTKRIELHGKTVTEIRVGCADHNQRDKKIEDKMLDLGRTVAMMRNVTIRQRLRDASQLHSMTDDMEMIGKRLREIVSTQSAPEGAGKYEQKVARLSVGMVRAFSTAKMKCNPLHIMIRIIDEDFYARDGKCNE